MIRRILPTLLLLAALAACGAVTHAALEVAWTARALRHSYTSAE